MSLDLLTHKHEWRLALRGLELVGKGGQELSRGRQRIFSTEDSPDHLASKDALTPLTETITCLVYFHHSTYNDQNYLIYLLVKNPFPLLASRMQIL